MGLLPTIAEVDLTLVGLCLDVVSLSVAPPDEGSGLGAGIRALSKTSVPRKARHEQDPRGLANNPKILNI